MSKYRKELNSLLKKTREEKKFSQTEWGNAAGVAQTQVARWEKDEGEPGIDNLRGLAGHLGITVAALIGDEQPKFAAPRPLEPEEKALAVFETFKLPKNKLEVVKAALACDDDTRLEVALGNLTQNGLPASGKSRNSTTG